MLIAVFLYRLEALFERWGLPPPATVNVGVVSVRFRIRIPAAMERSVELGRHRYCSAPQAGRRPAARRDHVLAA